MLSVEHLVLLLSYRMAALFVCWILIRTQRVSGTICLCSSSILDVLLVPMCEWSFISISWLSCILISLNAGIIKCFNVVLVKSDTCKWWKIVWWRYQYSYFTFCYTYWYNLFVHLRNTLFCSFFVQVHFLYCYFVLPISNFEVDAACMLQFHL